MKFKNLAYATFVAAAAVAFVIGSAVPSEAAKKKKAAAAAPPAAAAGRVAPADRLRCAQPRATMKFTYHNACWAAKDGAKGAKPGECKAAKKGGGKKMAKKKK